MASSIAVIPVERLNELELEAYKEAGFTIEVEGVDQIDSDALDRAIYERVMASLSRTKQEVPEKAVGKADLAANLFPAFPAPGSADWDKDDAEIVSVWGRLHKTVSTKLSTGRRGTIQKLLGEHEESKGLLMCNTTLDPSRKPAVYVTDVPALIEADFAGARTDKLINTSTELAKDLALAIERVPAMKRKLSSNWDKGLKQAEIKSRTVLQLTMGTDEA